MSTDVSDMTERERLARVVFGCHYDVFPWTDAREAEREDYRRIADAILAAGFGDVTAAKAAAWDESAEEHRDAAGNDYGDWPVNPYRAAEKIVPPEPTGYLRIQLVDGYWCHHGVIAKTAPILTPGWAYEFVGDAPLPSWDIPYGSRVSRFVVGDF